MRTSKNDSLNSKGSDAAPAMIVGKMEGAYQSESSHLKGELARNDANVA